MKKKKKTKTSPSPSPESDLQSSDFHTAVARISVAQICQSVGYKGSQTSALETLTDVAVRYLRSLASAAASSAASTGRTQCNLLDVLRALEDLHTYTTGFHGNSDPNRRLSLLADSSLLRETMKFVHRNREIPFSKPLPRRSRVIPPIPTCFSGDTAKPNHIPIWLPDFPKIDNNGEKSEETVARASEKKMNSIEISKLPEKRQKVSFKIGYGGGGGGGGRVSRNEIEAKIDIDLRNGVCKRGKRISFQIHDYDDENLLNTSSDHGDMMKKMIMMH